ncbi:XRE family transcriptional regulator [Candidatus Thiothrix sp. Deng01]|uniref:XRE family transcriptional regulator n=1 Tax=Candidatus Thiothrix phosphatis TaxID=3112415 RepID=A0ABU6CWJ0_9GAMM|nr:XRE family transcriptional regulator [Candidatus Thiothrix sp. Deng01]MEB4591149.1 XRE family transcriptional regulator [Candidatus Thiothrix sp. Deng01]
MSEGHTTPAGQSVFYDLFPKEQAANLLIRAQLLDELIRILQLRFATQAEAAAALDVSQARISDLYRGKIQRFTVDMLINLLARVGQSVEVHTRAAA